MYTRAIKKNLKILTRVSESQCQDATLSLNLITMY